MSDPTEAPDPQAQRAALIAASLKQKVPTAILDPTCVWQPSKDQAATQALANAAQQSQNYETAGAIFKNADGNYCYSIPVGGTSPGHFAFGVKTPPDQPMAAIYHTHPVGGSEGENEDFSPGDVDMAKRLKMSSYIKALTSGVVKRFDPGVTSTTREGTGLSAVNKSHGTLVPQTNTTS